jgi:hypothetical protein
MSDEWARQSDQQLAKIAQDGLQGQGAPVEGMRRLREAMERASESSDRYSRRMFWLTVIITLLTAVQLVGAIEVIKNWISR